MSLLNYISLFPTDIFRNTYILPKIIFNPLLVLSPHVFLLGLLFVDRAFTRIKGNKILVIIS